MDTKLLFPDPDERPLDALAPEGGYCSIFRTICCIGDSLSSGEFEIYEDDGNRRYYDIYEQSWGQYMARRTGAKVYNFSRGGLTAQEFLQAYAQEFDCYNEEKACQAYMIALGVNDLICRRGTVVGTKDDLLESGEQNTFAWQMGEIVRRFRKISPESKFFFLTMPRDSADEWTNGRQEAHRAILYDMVKVFPESYVIDLREYAPVYDEKFKDIYFLNGHLSPMGYKLTADLVMSYVDYIIRHNYSHFKTAGLIGKNLD
ncbi:MAG: SGNH/GDSL hydrolase family protein [Clostridia bacterium]|jgi:hypothetical protein|nr:SGNH/GDSL hydrolase family protein [Clostridia bacterium]